MNETRVLYLGRRTGRDDKLVQAFTTEPAGEECLFRFRRGGGWVVGGIYVTEAVVEDGILRTMMAPETWTGDLHQDRDQVAAWELQDRRAQQAHAARAAAARARREPTYEAALARLHPVMDCARTLNEAEQIADAVRGTLIASWHQRRRKISKR